ncbi:sulfite exporter TauE/SafE family protein [Microbacterium paludicola]|uniref:Probable membrane transporter protein n=1 Tax=Microbacterium paludicola TaxID=300019 RepID=A0A4Y9FZJ2_9MICO|nr:sulfite exporter TauE/SafE family protein [Microbacterium paludicola]MBF0815152.1 sulfite exporter TauE/SafE family protein [Microbacterium paludicola]TFU34414.1 sulfite exporter TauE/SafE family protein [Microbacterium paludicola]
MPELSALAWAALALGAVAVGVSKTALPGVNTLAIALFAAVLPARASTGALLLLLIVGDWFAIWMHRKHARLRALLPLIPALAAGMVLGWIFLGFADDTWTRRVIGAILLLVIAVTLWRRWRAGEDEPRSGRVAAVAYGTLGGFTTMVANAGGPVMTMYFLAARFPVRAFLGTAAWFFAGINLAKLPFSIGLGIIQIPTVLMDLLLIPGVIAGAFLGRMLLGRLDQRTFELVVIVLTIVGALYLLLA